MDMSIIMKMKGRIFLGALALGLAAAAAAHADGRDLALSTDGTIYQVHSDAYGALFPQGRDTDPTNQVIALDVTLPGGAVQRLLVPGTAGPETESLPSVVFADDSQTVFLLWETELNVHPLLQLAGFDGRNWSKVIQVTGNPFAMKTSPQFTISRDSYQDTNPDGTAATHYRTTLHLIWQEQNSANQLETFYSPIIVNDGVYIGWNPIYNLDDFLSAPPAAAATAPPSQASLVSAPLLQNGPDARTVVVAYTSAALSRLASIEIDVLPQQLNQLAEKARGHIVDLGKQGGYPANLPSLAEAVRADIVTLGAAFHLEVIQSIADQVKAEVLADGAQGLDLYALAEKARGHIVDLGAKLSGWGLRSTNGTDLAKILQIGDTPDPEPVNGSPAAASYLFQFRVASNLSVPRVGPGTVKLFASQSGDNLIVSWAQPDRLFYRNVRGDGSWSDPKQLIFSNNLDLNKAYQILGQRLGNH
jgi:hypothetical protein